MADSRPGSGPGHFRYFKPYRKNLSNTASSSNCEKVDSVATKEANKG